MDKAIGFPKKPKGFDCDVTYFPAEAVGFPTKNEDVEIIQFLIKAGATIHSVDDMKQQVDPPTWKDGWLL